MEKVPGGGIEMDDQTIYCNALCTDVSKRKLSGASIWGRTQLNYRLFFASIVANSARLDVAMFS